MSDCTFFQGAGLLGVYGCLLLKEQFAMQRIICTDMNQDRLEFASEFGATESTVSTKGEVFMPKCATVRD